MESIHFSDLSFLPFWEKLTWQQQQTLAAGTTRRQVPKGRLLHNGSEDCIGLLLVISGQLRGYTLSEEGKEVTLYRLFERDLCLFSASCMLRSIHFDLMVAAAQDSVVLQISAQVYREIMAVSAPMANATNEIMASRFSDVMWLLDQILNKKLDARLAGLLLEEAQLTASPCLPITHEELAHHLGSAREVVTRMLHYLQQEGLIAISRGQIQILEEAALTQLAQGSLR